jgi:peptide/nickel transport system substrate-binding protein
VQIYLNMTHKDAKMREMFANKAFRQALSLGINRKEIIELVYWGSRSRTRPVRGPDTLVPREALAPVHQLRSEAGERPARWPRLQQARRAEVPAASRRQKVFFSVDIIPTLYPDAVDTMELVKRHWADIGIDIKVNTIERALYYTRGDSNDHDAAVWPGPGGLDPMLDPRDYFAQHTQGSRYAIPWTLWYVSGGKDGQEPPEARSSG